jgi:uncharacterized RDD family membrane protein YckC
MQEIKLPTTSKYIEHNQSEFSYNPLQRWVARWVDVIISIFVYILFLIIPVYIMSKYYWNEFTYFINNSDSEQFNNPGVSILFSIILLTPSLYYPLSIKIFGQTIGQKIASLKLVTINDKKPSFWRIVGRMLCNLIPASEFISLFMVLLRKDKKSLFDVICKTKNIQYKTQKHILAKSIASVILCHVAIILGFVGLFYFFQAVPVPKINIKPIEINQTIGYEIIQIEKMVYNDELKEGFIIINDPTEAKQIEISKILMQKYGYGVYNYYGPNSDIKEVLRDWKTIQEAIDVVGTLNYFDGTEPAIYGGSESNSTRIVIN